MTEEPKFKILIGKVVSIDDPTHSGRIKVKINGYNDNIDVKYLPWCNYGGSPISSANGGGSISIPRVGQIVRVRCNSVDIDANDLEWYAVSQLDKDLINEIKDDYDNAHVLLYDSANDLGIKYLRQSGLSIYYSGSNIQITPDGVITITYNNDSIIQLRDGQVDIAGNDINVTAKGTLNLEGDNIVINGKQTTQIKGSTSGECAVNGAALTTLLDELAVAIDAKCPNSTAATNSVVASKASLLNKNIQFI